MELQELRERASKVKVIVCDLDDTLLNSEKQISDANMAAIAKAAQKGILTTVCSGRLHLMMEVYDRQLNIDGPVVGTNGAVIYHGRTREILYQRLLGETPAKVVVDFCFANGIDFCLLTAAGNYFPQYSVRIKRFIQYNNMADERELEPMRLEYLENRNAARYDADIYKILIYEINPGDFNKAMAFLATLDDISFTPSETGLIEVLDKGIDKGEGIRQLRKLMGLKKEEVCAFGDYHNDYDMLKEAGFPIAMENAVDEVKSVAIAITDSSEQSGVATAIEKYFL